MGGRTRKGEGHIFRDRKTFQDHRKGGCHSYSTITHPPPLLLPSTTSRMCRMWKAPKRWDVGQSVIVSQSVRHLVISKSVKRDSSDGSLSLMVAANINVKQSRSGTIARGCS